MLVNMQDFSVSTAHKRIQNEPPFYEDLLWSAQSLEVFIGLTYVGTSLLPDASWWVDHPAQLAYLLLNQEQVSGDNLMCACCLATAGSFQHTHILCHLHDFEHRCL